MPAAIDPERMSQAAILFAKGKSGREVAEAIGVNKNTVSKWRKDVNFNRQIDELSIADARSTLRRAVGYSREVVDFYYETFKDEDANMDHRLKAAKEIMACLNTSLNEVYSRRIEEAERILEGAIVETTVIEERKPRKIDMETL